MILLPLLFSALIFSPALAMDPEEADLVPHIGKRGRAAFVDFLFSAGHRAFAIAPGGAWAWDSNRDSRAAAEREALDQCQQVSQQRCVLYAVDEERVFDSEAWATLWGPYRPASDGDEVEVGTEPGKRFPDLRFKSDAGQPLTLSDFRGSVVLLHFWGSWCPHCCREIPELQDLSKALHRDEPIELVLLQVRESFAESTEWSRKLKTPIRLYDSGVSGTEDTLLSLADGSEIEDSQLAQRFPSTFVLDGNGIVLFSRAGAVRRWDEYLPFLRDAARHTAGTSRDRDPALTQPRPRRANRFAHGEDAGRADRS